MEESYSSFAFPGLIHIPIFGVVLYFREKTTYILVSFFLLSGFIIPEKQRINHSPPCLLGVTQLGITNRTISENGMYINPA
jgi:hypothetical protein